MGPDGPLQPNTMSASRTQRSQCPPLLERLYGAGNVHTLHDFLLRQCKASKEAEHLDQVLVQQHDHPDYSARLLQNTFCVLAPSAARQLTPGFSLQQHCTQVEVRSK